jgi:hypothetical protein
MDSRLLQNKAIQNCRGVWRNYKEWYQLACVCGLEFIEARIPEAVFKSQTFDLNVELFKLHTIYCLKMLNITMMTIFCT